jgi:hypothetical protein
MPGWMSVRNLSRCANEKISPEMRGHYFLFRVKRLEQPVQGSPARWASFRVHYLHEGHCEVRRLPFEAFPDPLSLPFSSSEHDRFPPATKHYRRPLFPLPSLVPLSQRQRTPNETSHKPQITHFVTKLRVLLDKRGIPIIDYGGGGSG